MSHMLQILALRGAEKDSHFSDAHQMALADFARKALKTKVLWSEEELTILVQSAHDEGNTPEEFERRLNLHLQAGLAELEERKKPGPLFETPRTPVEARADF